MQALIMFSIASLRFKQASIVKVHKLGAVSILGYSATFLFSMDASNLVGAKLQNHTREGYRCPPGDIIRACENW